ncbi:MAG: Arm DNA-binding domain-containing protein, partial [Actinomycetes bacterium]
MKRGHVRQRHTRKCPRTEDGDWAPHRCRGSWGFLVDLRRDGTGERRQITKAGFASKRAAMLALQRCLEDMHGGVDVETRGTVAEYLEEWISSKRALRPSTLKSYREHIRLYLAPLLGHIPLRDLRPRQIDLMLNELVRPRAKRSLSPATVRRIHSTLRVALNDAVRRRLISHNPTQHVELPTESRRPATVWTPEQVTAFLDGSRNDRLYALYHL